jgi:ESCRT-I complex subunit TSG101
MRLVPLQQSTILSLFQNKRNELKKILNNAKSSQKEEGDELVDSVIDAATPLHRQIVHCYVQDCTIDDTIYFLGQALKKGSINLEAYLKYVRELSRKQFIHRATMQKARQLAKLPI